LLGIVPPIVCISIGKTATEFIRTYSLHLPKEETIWVDKVGERLLDADETRHKNCRHIYSEMAAGTTEMSRKIVKTMDEYDMYTRVKIVAVIRRIDSTISM
jgi:hypothetical protein